MKRSKPRICFVCGNLYPLLVPTSSIPIVGGAEVQQYIIGKELTGHGFDVCYITEDYGQGYLSTSVDGSRILSYAYGNNKKKQAATLWRALKHANADIYYVRSTPKFGAMIFTFCRLYGRRIVQALANNTEVVPVHLKGIVDRALYLSHAFWRSRADLVIAQTRCQHETLKLQWHTNSVVIPNIVYPNNTTLIHEHRDRLTALWVASISPRKRIEILEQLAKRMPDVQFVVVGGPARGMQAYYEQVRSRVSMLSNVQWCGNVPHQRMSAYFNIADVLLHTSDGYREGFPNVFLEAWANGIPVLSYGTDPDGIIAKYSLGFPSISVDQMSEVLHRISEDRGLLQRLGQNARDYISAAHVPEVIIPRYVSLFSSMAPTRVIGT